MEGSGLHAASPSPVSVPKLRWGRALIVEREEGAEARAVLKLRLKVPSSQRQGGDMDVCVRVCVCVFNGACFFFFFCRFSSFLCLMVPVFSFVFLARDILFCGLKGKPKGKPNIWPVP